MNQKISILFLFDQAVNVFNVHRTQLSNSKYEEKILEILKNHKEEIMNSSIKQDLLFIYDNPELKSKIFGEISSYTTYKLTFKDFFSFFVQKIKPNGFDKKEKINNSFDFEERVKELLINETSTKISYYFFQYMFFHLNSRSKVSIWNLESFLFIFDEEIEKIKAKGIVNFSIETNEIEKKIKNETYLKRLIDIKNNNLRLINYWENEDYEKILEIIYSNSNYLLSYLGEDSKVRFELRVKNFLKKRVKFNEQIDPALPYILSTLEQLVKLRAKYEKDLSKNSSVSNIQLSNEKWNSMDKKNKKIIMRLLIDLWFTSSNFAILSKNIE